MNIKTNVNQRKIEEETLLHYNPLDFYPTRVGEIVASKYRIIGKLGFGANSTVWLARGVDESGSQSLAVARDR